MLPIDSAAGLMRTTLARIFMLASLVWSAGSSPAQTSNNVIFNFSALQQPFAPSSVISVTVRPEVPFLVTTGGVFYPGDEQTISRLTEPGITNGYAIFSNQLEGVDFLVTLHTYYADYRTNYCIQPGTPTDTNGNVNAGLSVGPWVPGVGAFYNITHVGTSNSASVTWSGDGSPGNPLTAVAAGGLGLTNTPVPGSLIFSPDGTTYAGTHDIILTNHTLIGTNPTAGLNFSGASELGSATITNGTVPTLSATTIGPITGSTAITLGGGNITAGGYELSPGGLTSSSASVTGAGFYGNGSGVSNVPASQLTGTLPQSALPTNAVQYAYLKFSFDSLSPTNIYFITNCPLAIANGFYFAAYTTNNIGFLTNGNNCWLCLYGPNGAYTGDVIQTNNFYDTIGSYAWYDCSGSPNNGNLPAKAGSWEADNGPMSGVLNMIGYGVVAALTNVFQANFSTFGVNNLYATNVLIQPSSNIFFGFSDESGWSHIYAGTLGVTNGNFFELQGGAGNALSTTLAGEPMFEQWKINTNGYLWGVKSQAASPDWILRNGNYFCSIMWNNMGQTAFGWLEQGAYSSFDANYQILPAFVGIYGQGATSNCAALYLKNGNALTSNSVPGDVQPVNGQLYFTSTNTSGQTNSFPIILSGNGFQYNGSGLTNVIDTNIVSQLAANAQILTYNSVLKAYFPSNAPASSTANTVQTNSNGSVTTAINFTNSVIFSNSVTATGSGASSVVATNGITVTGAGQSVVINSNGVTASIGAQFTGNGSGLTNLSLVNPGVQTGTNFVILNVTNKINATGGIAVGAGIYSGGGINFSPNNGNNLFAINFNTMLEPSSDNYAPLNDVSHRVFDGYFSNFHVSTNLICGALGVSGGIVTFSNSISVAVGVGPSPFLFTNTSGGNLYADFDAASSITCALAKNGVTLISSQTGVAVEWWLKVGEVAQVTYSGGTPLMFTNK